MTLSYFDEVAGGVLQPWGAHRTSLGTHVVATFAAGAISNLTTIGARVFFSLNDGTHGHELSTSDGTAATICSTSDTWAKNSSRATASASRSTVSPARFLSTRVRSIERGRREIAGRIAQ